MLWTWKPSSFIPHIYIDPLEFPQEELVIITSKINENCDFNILIMIDPVPGRIMRQFNTIIDFAEKYDLSGLKNSRERYKEFKKENFKLKTMQPGEFLSSKIE